MKLIIQVDAGVVAGTMGLVFPASIWFFLSMPPDAVRAAGTKIKRGSADRNIIRSEKILDATIKSCCLLNTGTAAPVVTGSSGNWRKNINAEHYCKREAYFF